MAKGKLVKVIPTAGEVSDEKIGPGLVTELRGVMNASPWTTLKQRA